MRSRKMKTGSWVIGLAMGLILSVGMMGSCGSGQGSNAAASNVKVHPDTLLAREVKALGDQILKDPKNAKLYYERAVKLEKAKLKEAAMRDLREAVQLDSTKLPYLEMAGRLSLEAGNLKESLGYYEVAVKINAKDHKMWLQMGKIYFYVKDRERSIKSLNNAIDLEPTDAEAFMYRALNYREDGKTKQAIKNLEDCIALNPSYYEAYDLMGVVLSDKEPKRSVEYFTSALRLQPASLVTLYNRGLQYLKLDSQDLAKADFEAILVSEPEHRDVNYLMGEVQEQAKEWQKAAEHYHKARSADKTYMEAYQGEERMLRKLGKAVDAEAVAKERKLAEAEMKGKGSKKKPKGK